MKCRSVQPAHGQIQAVQMVVNSITAIGVHLHLLSWCNIGCGFVNCGLMLLELFNSLVALLLFVASEGRNVEIWLEVKSAYLCWVHLCWCLVSWQLLDFQSIHLGFLDKL